MEELEMEKSNREKQLETGDEESANRSQMKRSSRQVATREREQQSGDGWLTGL